MRTSYKSLQKLKQSLICRNRYGCCSITGFFWMKKAKRGIDCIWGCCRRSQPGPLRARCGFQLALRSSPKQTPYLGQWKENLYLLHFVTFQEGHSNEASSFSVYCLQLRPSIGLWSSLHFTRVKTQPDFKAEIKDCLKKKILNWVPSIPAYACWVGEPGASWANCSLKIRPRLAPGTGWWHQSEHHPSCSDGNMACSFRCPSSSSSSSLFQ